MNYRRPSLGDRLASARVGTHGIRFLTLSLVFGAWMGVLYAPFLGVDGLILAAFITPFYGPFPAALCTAMLAIRDHGVNLCAQMQSNRGQKWTLAKAFGLWSLLMFSGFAIGYTVFSLVGFGLSEPTLYILSGLVPSLVIGGALTYSDYRRATA